MENNELNYNELRCLYEITTLILKESDVDHALTSILNILSNIMNLKRGIISILDKNENEIYHDSFGFQNPDDKIKFLPGEGITGRVIDTGLPIAIPRLDKEPLFLDKTGIRKSLNKSELSFICVPIIYKNKTIGALSVDITAKDEEDSLAKEIDFLLKVTVLIAEIVNKKSLYSENLQLKEMIQKSNPLGIIIGNSKIMRELAYQITTIANSNISVLITGETGTGKELVAHEIHNQSQRKNNPFIVINCGAIPENLIESELFGHKKGSFTGATSDRIGKFEAADNGTIFLDEIGDLPLMLQVKLLRVLQEKEIVRIGENIPKKINVRIIAATHKNLEKLIEENKFRTDLFYRLNVFNIYMPPLKDRGADILLLADFFTKKYSKEFNKNIIRLDTPSIDMLMSYHWPGNVRELENCIERACLLTNDDTIHSHNLPPTLQMKTSGKDNKKNKFETLVKIYEIELITDALKEAKGNQTKASEILGTTKRIIQYKIEQYGIEYNRFKEKK